MMKTVIETREELYRRHIPEAQEKPSFIFGRNVPIFTPRDLPKRKSCFYDFGARKMAGFGEIAPPSKEKTE